MFTSPLTDKAFDWPLVHEEKCKKYISILDAYSLIDADQWTNVLEALPIIRGHQGHFPIQVMPIATDLGLNIYHVKDWPDKFSGMVQKDPYSRSRFAIYLNDN